MILPLKYYPDPILKSKCKPIEMFDQNILQLIENMKESIVYHKGIGLAANQVGFEIALFILNHPDLKSPLAIVNPEILETRGKEKYEEGCLSFPELYLEIARPNWVKLVYDTPDDESRIIELEGILARAALHEFDHLNGIEFIDRISLTKKHLIKKELEDITKKYGNKR